MNEADRIKYVTKGESFRESLTAAAWNAFAETANARELGNSETGINTTAGKDRPTLGDCRVPSTVNRLEILGIDDQGIDTATREVPFTDLPRVDFRNATLADTHIGRFGIAIDGTSGTATNNGEDQVTSAVLSGVYVCRVWVPANGSWLARADIDTGNKDRLLAKPNGSAQILWKESGDDMEVNAIVRLGNPTYVELAGKADGDIDPDTSTGVVEIFDKGTTTNYKIGTGEVLNEPVHLDWMHGDLKISSGKELLVAWFPYEQRWRIVGAECEDPEEPAIGQISDGPDSDPDQLVTTTPAPWEVFDASESLSTPNVTTNAAGASITIPAVTKAQGQLYSYNYSGVVTPGSNNNTYSIEATVDGVLNGHPLLVDGRQANSSLSFSFSGYLVIPQKATPTTVGLTIATLSGSDTMGWNGAQFSMTKNLDFD